MKKTGCYKLAGAVLAGMFILSGPFGAAAEAAVEDYSDQSMVMAGVKLTGWQTIDGKKYYYNDEGRKVKGPQKIDGNWYYFNSAGEMQTGAIKLQGNWYYLDPETGAMLTGPQQIDGNWYYFNSQGIMQTGPLKLKGNWYYFNSKGVMQTGAIKLDGNWYYLDPETGAMHTGWLKLNGKTYYMNSKGIMQKGWKKIDGKYYAFNSKGIMLTGWLTYNERNYYLQKDGSMTIGSIVIDGVSYLFGEDGALIENAYDFSSAEIGDQVLFGYYEQDNDLTNGMERISWTVLDQSDDGILLISDDILDCKKFNETETDVTWATSDLHTWLNGDFLNTAFNSAEQEIIKTTLVVTPDNESYGTDSGDDTNDKVFMLSYDEAMSYFGEEEFTATSPIPYTYTGSKLGAATPTAYAIAQGVSQAQSSEWYGGCGEYWLRSMGGDQTFAASVSDCGYLYEGGSGICNTGMGIRPVISVKR